MTIPTSWTDNGLTWEVANPMWTFAELNLCMIEAIKEKDSATGRTVPTLLSDAYNPIRPNWDYVSTIHAEVTALIPLFINHSTLSNWTESTILAAIGDSVRIISTHLGTLSAWYYQTKKILDMLSWRTEVFTRSVDYDMNTDERGIRVQLISYEAAVLQFNNTPWGTYNYHERIGSAGHYLEMWAPRFENALKVIKRCKERINFINNTPYSILVDTYYKFAKTLPLATYINNDYPYAVVDDAYYKQSSDIVLSQNEVIEDEIGNFGDCSIPIPVFTPDSYEVIGCGWSFGGAIAVLKFDGANGFRFRE